MAKTKTLWLARDPRPGAFYCLFSKAIRPQLDECPCLSTTFVSYIRYKRDGHIHSFCPLRWARILPKCKLRLGECKPIQLKASLVKETVAKAKGPKTWVARDVGNNYCLFLSVKPPVHSYYCGPGWLYPGWLYTFTCEEWKKLTSITLKPGECRQINITGKLIQE